MFVNNAFETISDENSTLPDYAIMSIDELEFLISMAKKQEYRYYTTKQLFQLVADNFNWKED